MDLILQLFDTATGFIDSIAALVTDSPLTYLVLFALAAVDVLVPVVPSEASITAAAVLAGQGQLNIVWIMLAAGLGAFIGDNVAYWVGRAAGRPLVRRILRGDSDQLDRVQQQFARRGAVFIIIGRFVPGGRSAVAISAGILHLPWLRFLIYDAIAVLIWVFPTALPGFIGGRLIEDRPWLAMIIGFAFSLAVVGTITISQHWWENRGRMARRWRRFRGQPEAPEPEEGADD